MTLPAASKGSRPSQSSRPTLGETMRPIQRSFLIILLIAWLATLSACQTQRSVLIQADGQSRLVTVVRAETVGDALEEAGLTLGEKDRVTPDIYARLPRSGSITVVRVTERTEMEVEAIPFEREVLRDESVQKGETRLVRAGAQGQRQRTYRVTLEDGVPVRRELVADRISHGTGQRGAAGGHPGQPGSRSPSPARWSIFPAATPGRSAAARATSAP